MQSRVYEITLAPVVSLWATIVPAQAVELHVVGEMNLQVRSEKSAEANVTLTGRLLDESGQPLAGTLQVEEQTGSLIALSPCNEGDAQETKLKFEIGPSGEFCVNAPRASGPLLATATVPHFQMASVAVSPARDKVLPAPRFTQTPQVVDRGGEDPAVVEVLASSGGVSTSVTLSLELKCESSTTALGTRVLLGSRLERFEISLPQDGPHGQCQFLARTQAPRLLGKKEEKSVLVRNRVTLKSASSDDSGDSLVAKIRADAGTTPVDTGLVEARSRGAFLLSAPVREGIARLDFERGLEPLDVDILYVSSDPALIAEDALTLTIPSKPVGFQWATLHTAILLLFAAWLGYAWVRPRTSAPRANLPAPPLEATVEGSGKGAAPISGQVRDAHTGREIFRATVELLSVNVESKEVLEKCSTDHLGRFSFETLADQHPILKLQVRSEEHVTFTAPVIASTLVVHVTGRRRAIVFHLVQWARRAGAPWFESSPPTPGEIGRTARRTDHPPVERWAQAISAAAYGEQAPTEEAVEVLKKPAPPFS